MPALARIDGNDRAFLFGNARHPLLAPGCSPFPSRSGTTQVSRGLGLVHNNCIVVCLEFDTTRVSSGVSPVTLTPGGGGGNLFIVCPTGKYLFVYSVYLFTDIIEGDRAHPGPFRAIFGPPSQGGQNRKNRDCARTRCAVVSTFGAHTLVCIPERITPLPRRRVYVCRFGCGGRVSTLIVVSHSVRLFLSLDTFLTYSTHCFRWGKPPCMSLAS